ncbi:MAG: hypothetical protein HDQ88_04930 [Clostridia bacterium]|nr:hypothetical protein [Clostridia bacterium]
MKLFIDDHFYISAMNDGHETFNCRIMELVHGIGMDPAYITEPKEDLEDIVGSIVYESDIFSETSRTVHSTQALCEYHKQCLVELLKSDY